MKRVDRRQQADRCRLKFFDPRVLGRRCDLRGRDVWLAADYANRQEDVAALRVYLERVIDEEQLVLADGESTFELACRLAEGESLRRVADETRIWPSTLFRRWQQFRIQMRIRILADLNDDNDRDDL